MVFRRKTTNPKPWLQSGPGLSPEFGGCVMQVVDWLTSGGWTDKPACVHEAIREMAIAINDYSSDRHRQKLLKLVPHMIGTNWCDAHIRAKMWSMYERSWPLGLITYIPWVGYGLTTHLAMLRLRWMLNKYNRMVPRKTFVPDYSGVCAVMAGETRVQDAECVTWSS